MKSPKETIFDKDIKEALANISYDSFIEIENQQKQYNFSGLLKSFNPQEITISFLLYCIEKEKKAKPKGISYEEYNELGRKYNDLIVQKQELAEKCKELQKKEKELMRDKIFLQNSFKENTQIIASQYEQCLQRFYEQYEQ